jgi:hypothetical protein
MCVGKLMSCVRLWLMLRLNAACPGTSVEVECASHWSWWMLKSSATAISVFGWARSALSIWSEITENISELADGER